MKTPNEGVMLWLAAELAMREIEAMAERRDALKATLGDWFPDADEFDRRALADLMKNELSQLVRAMHNRSERLINEGRMEAIT